MESKLLLGRLRVLDPIDTEGHVHLLRKGCLRSEANKSANTSVDCAVLGDHSLISKFTKVVLLRLRKHSTFHRESNLSNCREKHEKRKIVRIDTHDERRETEPRPKKSNSPPVECF